jgi:hypothetical protein
VTATETALAVASEVVHQPVAGVHHPVARHVKVFHIHDFVVKIIVFKFYIRAHRKTRFLTL